MTRSEKIKVEKKNPISEQGYTIGKLLNGTECQTLLNTGASKSFMSKMHYLKCNPCTYYQNLYLKLGRK